MPRWEELVLLKLTRKKEKGYLRKITLDSGAGEAGDREGNGSLWSSSQEVRRG